MILSVRPLFRGSRAHIWPVSSPATGPSRCWARIAAPVSLWRRPSSRSIGGGFKARDSGGWSRFGCRALFPHCRRRSPVRMRQINKEFAPLRRLRPTWLSPPSGRRRRIGLDRARDNLASPVFCSNSSKPVRWCHAQRMSPDNGDALKQGLVEPAESIATRGIPRLDSSVTLRRPAARE